VRGFDGKDAECGLLVSVKPRRKAEDVCPNLSTKDTENGIKTSGMSWPTSWPDALILEWI
jgi:hypothetical protein